MYFLCCQLETAETQTGSCAGVCQAGGNGVSVQQHVWARCCSGAAAAVAAVQYLEAYGDNSATDLLPHHELFSQHGQYDVLPEPTGQTFPQTDDPLPPTAVRLVLPGKRVREVA